MFFNYFCPFSLTRIPAFIGSFNMSKLFWESSYIENTFQIYMAGQYYLQSTVFQSDHTLHNVSQTGTKNEVHHKGAFSQFLIRHCDVQSWSHLWFWKVAAYLYFNILNTLLLQPLLLKHISFKEVVLSHTFCLEEKEMQNATPCSHCHLQHRCFHFYFSNDKVCMPPPTPLPHRY